SRISTRPKCASVRAATSSTAAGSVRSAGSTRCSEPSSLATTSSRSCERATNARRQPPAPRARASARPIPELAPVTSATFPANSCCTVSPTGSADNRRRSLLLEQRFSAVDTSRRGFAHYLAQALICATQVNWNSSAFDRLLARAPDIQRYAGEPIHRKLRDDRRLQYGGAGGAGRLNRLALLAPLRFRRNVCAPPRNSRTRPLADRSCRGGRGERTPLPRQHADPRNPLHSEKMGSRGHRLHADRRRHPSHPSGEGPFRLRPYGNGAGDPLRLRPRPALDAAHRRRRGWRQRAARGGWTRHGGAAHPGRDG